MPCNHKPVFKFSQLFSRKPEYVCQKCGKKIQLIARFRNALRVLNALFIMIILFRAFNTTDAPTDLKSFWINMAILFGFAAAYLLVLILIVRFGPYEEVYDENEETESDAPQSSDPDLSVSSSMDEATDESEENSSYTEEQKQLMEMYAAYEKQAVEKEQKQPDRPSKPLPEVPECKHEPVATWKNYIPSKMDFVCKNCGEQITFTASRKKSINLIFLAVMAIILMPNFMNDSVNFWEYLLLTLGALAVATLLQIFFVKKWPLELKK
ncbi:MAG: hypothetical protein PHQ55_06970 [Eubacteriales bacterium]|nr:hypothetical protein [Eubacteriales bacterium]MDD3197935.1 hypothetical protein [Eubacteriales bacterium]MDD3503266.1 hypothetical protein [Eubacteriales bacterium]MDD4682899.1 hypothetical protein [Eubacteriales bacterium]